MLGDQKTAMFVIISNTDDTFNFIVAIMYTQLFNLLCDKADDEHGGRLPYHVRLLLDEFSNIGQIPKFDKLIATIRSREISASIILQSQSQLKTIYKDAAETIIGNCDTVLFLGGKESSTLKEISETLGKASCIKAVCRILSLRYTGITSGQREGGHPMDANVEKLVEMPAGGGSIRDSGQAQRDVPLPVPQRQKSQHEGGSAVPLLRLSGGRRCD